MVRLFILISFEYQKEFVVFVFLYLFFVAKIISVSIKQFFMYFYLGVMFPIVPVVDRFRCESIELTLFNVGECCPIVGEAGLFFQGWNPLPIAASANGGGDLLDNLLH